MIRIVDVINTAASAREILLDRVRPLHRPPAIENWIVCSAGDDVDHVRAAGVPVAVIDTPRGLEPIALARGVWRLTRFFRSLQPHLVHTHSSIPGALGRIAARAAGVPLVVHTVHGFHFHRGSRLPSKLYSLATERALAGLTDVLLMQNREDLRIVRRWRGVRARLIGDGPLRPQCERAAAELGIAAATEFVGYRKDVAALLADVDVVVLLSWKEGIPRGLLEPMAAHIPVVAWRVKGNREVVRSGESGLLAPPGDLDETTAHIVRLLEDPALRRRLGAAAAERVRTHFNESVVVAHLARVYASLLREAGYPLPTSWETHDERAVLSA